MESVSSDSLGVATILRLWEDEHQTPNYDPVPVLTKLAELIEVETENYMKMDPDPFDERHPSRADPDCALGQMLKVLFRKETFMNKLVNDYLRDNYWARAGNNSKDTRKLNIAACRLMLDIMPGLETSAVFQVPEMEGMILRLYSWAEKSIQPLQSYATGLLAAAMEVQDIAVSFREQNSKLIPLKLQELHKLQAKAAEERQILAPNPRPFAHLGLTMSLKKTQDTKVLNGLPNTRAKKRAAKEALLDTNHATPLQSPPEMSPPFTELAGDSSEVRLNGSDSTPPRKMSRESEDGVSSPEVPERPRRHLAQDSSGDMCVMSPPPVMLSKHPPTPLVVSPSAGAGGVSECSNSSWAEMESYVIGNVQIYPPTLATRQMLILRYLTPMGEYQEFLGHVFEQNALELILKYTNLQESRDSRLAFEALKYLSALLCHKKFSIEFINMKGLQTLLRVPRPSVAATGVSICLYYLAYCEDAMERVCQLPPHIITDLVKYTLWLLECSHASGRCHATMFFGLTFQFRVILAEFDKQDGLRKLYNLISTLPILSIEDEATLNDDEECAARQIVRHVCVALKRYLESHLCIKAESLRRTLLRESGGQVEPLIQLPKVKAGAEDIKMNISTLFELMPFRSHWEPVDELFRLGGITLLLQIIAFAYEWNYSGRAETVRNALDALAICSVMPRVQLLLCDRVDLPDDAITVGLNIVLGAAEGEIVADADVQRAALQVLINCVCAPVHRVGGNVGRFSVSGSANKKKTCFRSSEELIMKLWESLRSNNGIMVLLQLMMVKTPITDADSIRALACKALTGLARSETVRQIVSKLPLFTNGQLQMLMRDPILQDKRQEHVMFQKSALELMEKVSGKSKPIVNELEVSLSNIHRANVVAQTRIQYNDKQLYQLIHQHLLSRGLSESAAALHREAGLPGTTTRQGPTAGFPPYYHRGVLSPGTPRQRMSVPGGPLHHHRGALASPAGGSHAARALLPGNGSSVTQGGAGNSTTQPIKLNLANARKSDRSVQPPTTNSSCRSLQKQISWEVGNIPITSPVLKINSVSAPSISEPRITLDSIITEYLTNQHALCKNPMVPCPQFNLFEPHKCPDPKAKNSAPSNFTMRITRRSYGLRRWDVPRLDRKLIFSRFCPVKTFRLGDDEGFFTCCEFLPCDQNLIMGTYQGEVKMFNIYTGTEEATYQCHESYVYNLAASRDRSLLLTSSTWRRPLSALWTINKFFEMKFPLPEEEYVEFSKLTQDKIIGTKSEIATIYDVATGKVVLTLQPQISNQYTKNRATFNPTDELVLSDGVLWDVNSGKEIHKLDKLSQTLSGVFHPNGLEIVSNTEVWDLRTFHLLRTVPALDQCEVMFSPAGNTIYTVSLEQETEEDSSFETSFKTLDAFDYSSIATIDVKRNIYDLSCNSVGTQIAIVENQGMFDSVQESSVRLYDVGRRRDDEDEGEEEEDEDMEDGSEDGTASPSGSDDENQDAAGVEANENGENNGDDNNANEEDGDDGSDSDDVAISLSDSGDTDELEDLLFAAGLD